MRSNICSSCNLEHPFHRSGCKVKPHLDAVLHQLGAGNITKDEADRLTADYLDRGPDPYGIRAAMKSVQDLNAAKRRKFLIAAAADLAITLLAVTVYVFAKPIGFWDAVVIIALGRLAVGAFWAISK